jgi:AbrB family looped-hinge helix DNA binding protein
MLWIMLVTLSSKGQLVLPAPVRRQLGLKPRARLRLTMGNGFVSLAPVTPRAEPVPHLPPGAFKLSPRDYGFARLHGTDEPPTDL